MFKSSSERIEGMLQKMREDRLKTLRFGISYLDAATRAIFPSDLVLIGAPTGVGKTELCLHIALANIEDGKKVHFIALEADKNEIEKRMVYALVVRQFYDDAARPHLQFKMNMANWVRGDFSEHPKIIEYEKIAVEYLSKTLGGLFTFYKADKFDVDDLTLNIFSVASKTDLVIVDHIHFFDWEASDDNRAIKEIAKATRQLSQVLNKPIILVAHLRKRDKNNKEIVPSIDEFHGSSDLSKIATKVITMARGPLDSSGKEVTYFRVCKNRIDGSITRYVGRVLFDYKKRAYDEKIKLSDSFDKFQELSVYPWWAQEIRDYAGPGMGGPSANVVQRKPFGIEG